MLAEHHKKSLSNILQVPEKCVCEYQVENAAYKCQFQVRNNGECKVYLSINSTFYKFMEIQSKVSELNKGQSKMFMAKIRPPNQIYPLQQFIGISYSDTPYASFTSILDSETRLKVKLQFTTEITEDLEIDNILLEESEKTLEEANKIAQKGNLKISRQKAEEAFVLYRRNISSLIVIAESQLQENDISSATKTIDLLFYYPNHPEYFKAVMIKAEIIIIALSAIEKQLQLSIIVKMIEMLKDINQSTQKVIQYEKRSSQAMAILQKLKHQFLTLQRNQQFQRLIKKAQLNYDQNMQIKQKFPTKEQFVNFLNQKLIQQHRTEEQTPEYALDPVNYQIYKDPVIVPSGISYEKNFIVKFFQKHGPQDPFTRAYLDPNLVFNNNNLKNLVINSPSLQKWIKFEETSTKI